jgi:prevent-host-death family protein
MDSIGAVEAEANFTALLDRVARGETVTITDHGRPVAVLSPPAVADTDRRRMALERLRTFGQGRRLGMDWRVLRDEGRRY